MFASSTVDVLLTHFLSSPTTDANRRESGSRGRWVLGTRRPWRRSGAVGVEVLLVRGALGGGRRWRQDGEVGVEVLLVRGALGGGLRWREVGAEATGREETRR